MKSKVIIIIFIMFFKHMYLKKNMYVLPCIFMYNMQGNFLRFSYYSIVLSCVQFKGFVFTKKVFFINTALKLSHSIGNNRLEIT